jgi:pyrimidine-nucleoside phosphorylase
MRNTYRSPVSGEVYAEFPAGINAGEAFISRIDAWKVGHASVLLGVGRNSTEDQVCPTAGVEFHHKSGSRVKAGEKIMSVWAANEAGLKAALPALKDAVRYSGTAPEIRRLILKEIR